MSYTVSQVLGSNPEALLAASHQAQEGARRVNSQIEEVRGKFAELKDDWIGTAADAAQKQGREMFEDQVAYRDKLYEVATPLASGGKELTELRSSLKAAIDSAEAWWDVGDTGSVKPGLWLSWYASLTDVNALIVESRRIPVECDIKLKLAQFEAADRDTAYQVRKVGWELT
ncbi:WXG100 family type VII secretion target [Mycolicibacterium houstonense]|uniref:WXG100 family type VII secretion target n=1 Tax=Mycolicibacterium houstonense TaxID=146021 RepID=UPI00082F295B|nr:WXG100 family type VII secretion target [Mycolicibacterium houstonense]